ncbi:DUF1702 family protein [Streptosporangium sp. NPDC051023]|uniref:DUF1702 family protein n=1 Tax=Streptosporangium sp. NPDC051023 TaxID=3155410 RepID=UPI003450C966
MSDAEGNGEITRSDEPEVAAVAVKALTPGTTDVPRAAGAETATAPEIPAPEVFVPEVRPRPSLPVNGRDGRPSGESRPEPHENRPEADPGEANSAGNGPETGRKEADPGESGRPEGNGPETGQREAGRPEGDRPEAGRREVVPDAAETPGNAPGEVREKGSGKPGEEDPGSAGLIRSPSELTPARPRGLAGLLWQDLGQAGFGVRRFRLGQARPHLEAAGQACLAGYNAVVAGEAERIDDLREELRGFAYEGAGMACATLDVLTITGGRRLKNLLSGQGMRHPHLIHLGTGWAYARLRMRPMWGIRSVHPLLRWLAFDGFGFHQGFFAADRTVGRQRTAGLLDRTRRAIFDQGVGRALWFHECAGVDDVILRVAEFPAGRRADLWSGVGLAAAYVGGADARELERLNTAAAEDGFRAHLVQGAAFAGAVRLISGTVPEHTATAVSALCEVDVEEAGHWTETAFVALGHNAHSGDQYQAWRAGVRKAWARRNRDS